MIRYTWRRLRRAPVPALGVLLFAVILSVVLCTLEKSTKEEVRKYEETFSTIPVTFSVSNLSGTKLSDLDIPYYFLYPFQRGGVLWEYVSDLELVVERRTEDGLNLLVGITSLALSPELSPDNGTTITWKDGYDESVFATGEGVCLIPEDMDTFIDEKTGEECVSLSFVEKKSTNGESYDLNYTCKLKVAGTYSGGDERKAVYCPYEVCILVYYRIAGNIKFQAIQATLKDNHDLEALREAKWAWFAEPNPLGNATVWEDGEYGYKYYPFALDINDDLLQWAKSTMESSIATNRICAVLVLILSAGAGMLIGFLMVRSRKREIALLRTMGTPLHSIFLGFALEQMMCFCLGIALGGAYNRWQPSDQLWLLTGIFFLGLTAALLIFLGKNLMTTIKEDE